MSELTPEQRDALDGKPITKEQFYAMTGYTPPSKFHSTWLPLLLVVGVIAYTVFACWLVTR